MSRRRKSWQQNSAMAMQDLLSNALAAVMVLMMLASAFAGSGKEFYKARGNKDTVEGRHALRRGDWEPAPAPLPDKRAPKYIWVHATILSQGIQTPTLRLLTETGNAPEYSYYSSVTKPARTEHVFCVRSRESSEWTISLANPHLDVEQILVEVTSDDEEVLRKKPIGRADLPADNAGPLVRICRNDDAVLRVGMAAQGRPAIRCE